MANEFRARTLVRIERFDDKGVLAILPGWNWRKKIRIRSTPPPGFVIKDERSGNFYAYANVNLRAEYARDLNFREWVK